MTTINHPIFKSNNDGDLKLESGEIDASQQFTAQIWKMWEAGKPVSTWMKQAVPRAGQYPLPDLQPQQAGPGKPEGPACDRLRHRLPEYRHDRHVGLLRASQRQPHCADRVRVEVLRRRSGGAEGWKFDPAKAVEILEGELKAKKGSTASTSCRTAPSSAAGS